MLEEEGRLTAHGGEEIIVGFELAVDRCRTREIEGLELGEHLCPVHHPESRLDHISHFHAVILLLTPSKMEVLQRNTGEILGGNLRGHNEFFTFTDEVTRVEIRPDSRCVETTKQVKEHACIQQRLEWVWYTTWTPCFAANSPQPAR